MALFVVGEFCWLSYHVLTQARFLSDDTVVITIQNLTMANHILPYFFLFLSLSSFVSLSFSVASFDGLRPLLVASHYSIHSLVAKRDFISSFLLLTYSSSALLPWSARTVGAHHESSPVVSVHGHHHCLLKVLTAPHPNIVDPSP